MPDDQQRERTTWQSLAAGEAGQLRFPGSSLVEERHDDEGEGWGSDFMDARLFRHWAVVAEPDDVKRWFREELTAMGWTVVQGFEGSLVVSSFLRENSGLMLRVWPTPPGKEWEDGRLHYDVTLADISSVK